MYTVFVLYLAVITLLILTDFLLVYIVLILNKCCMRSSEYNNNPQCTFTV